MARYTIYRHPQRAAVAVSDGGLFSGGRADRLLREGYRDAGLVEAGSEREALAKAQGRPPVAHQAASQAAGQRAPQSAARAQAPTPTSQRAATNRSSSAPPLAAMLRAGAAFFWFAVGIGVFAYMMRTPSLPDPGSGEFSRWMDFDEIEHFHSQLDGKRYWIVDVEGRWSGGEPERRVRTRVAPPGLQHRWFWWCGKSRAEFAELDRQYQRQGFERVSLHSFTDGEGRIRHSGVWHRVRPLSDATAQTPGT